MARKMTDRQFAVLQLVRHWPGQAPLTRKRICNHFGWRSDNAAQTALEALQRHGAVRLTGKRGGIELTAP